MVVRESARPSLLQDTGSRDVNMLCTGGNSMTNYNVVKNMYEDVAFPWIDDIIGRCTSEHQPDSVLVQETPTQISSSILCQKDKN